MSASMLKNVFKAILGRQGVSQTRRKVVTVAPRLEALEDRLVPTAGFNTAVGIDHGQHINIGFLDGTDKADHFTIRDNGQGGVDITGDHGFHAVGTNLDRLVVLTFGGDDTVRYSLTGNRSRDFLVAVRLGDGNDRFTGTLNRDINANRQMKVIVDGEAGDDLITMYGTPTAPNRAGDHLTDGLAINQNGLRIAAGASLELDLDGGQGLFNGNDRIFVDYQGELDGLLQIHARGGDGSDIVEVQLNLQAGSTGQVGQSSVFPATVEGGSGSDTLLFEIKQDPASHCAVFAHMNGGEDFFGDDFDVGRHTDNVSEEGLEAHF
jgi:hypothetical protein